MGATDQQSPNASDESCNIWGWHLKHFQLRRPEDGVCSFSFWTIVVRTITAETVVMWQNVRGQHVAVTQLRSKLEDLILAKQRKNTKAPQNKQQPTNHNQRSSAVRQWNSETYRAQTLKASLRCSRPAKSSHLPIALTSWSISSYPIPGEVGDASPVGSLPLTCKMPCFVFHRVTCPRTSFLAWTSCCSRSKSASNFSRVVSRDTNTVPVPSWRNPVMERPWTCQLW